MAIHTGHDQFIGTPFNPRTSALNLQQRWAAWDRYHVVDVFSDAYIELSAIRNTAGLIDMSPLSKYRIGGPDAGRLINKVITREANRFEVNQIFYTLWCNEEGKIVGDGVVCQLEDDSYLLSGDPTYRWLVKNAADLDAHVTDLTHSVALLALQGPKSRQILEAATAQDWSDLAFSRRCTTAFHGIVFDVLRQGFTGERGYELWVKAEDAAEVWDAVAEAAKPFGGIPAGFLAADLARIEAGLLIIGPDYTGGIIEEVRGAAIPVDPAHQATPFELGLESFIDFSKERFVGRQALLEEQAHGGGKNILIGLEISWVQLIETCQARGVMPAFAPQSIWQPLPVFFEGQPVGRATSVTWGPTVKQLIGFGHVQKQRAEIGTPYTVSFSIGSERFEVDAVAIELPFLPPRRSQ